MVYLPLERKELIALWGAANRNGCTDCRRHLVNAYGRYIRKHATKRAAKFRLMRFHRELQAWFWEYAYIVMPKYDPVRGAVSTFLQTHFDNAIGEFVARECYPVMMPPSYVRGASLVHRISNKLLMAGIPDTDANIAGRTSLSPWQVGQYRSKMIPARSLDAPVKSDVPGTMTWLDTLVADGSDPADALAREEMHQHLHDALHTLKLRELQIIKLYHGIDLGGEEETLEKIGVRLNLSKERVRQIKLVAYQKLRKYIEAKTAPPALKDGNRKYKRELEEA